jgi:hypothetical protein
MMRSKTSCSLRGHDLRSGEARRRRLPPLGWLLLSSCGLNICVAATNDIFPGDYYPSDPGDKIVSFYAFHRSSVGPYVDGHKAGDGKIGGQIFAVRGVNTFELSGMTASAVAVLTGADLVASPSTLSNAIGRRTSGLGDLRLGLTIWPINDRQGANYLGLSAIC